MTRARELATERVAARVARALLRLAGQSGREVDGGVLVDHPLSRQELAEMTGTTLYTVSRLLSGWEDAGIVEAGRERVMVRSLERLAAVAETEAEENRPALFAPAQRPPLSPPLRSLQPTRRETMEITPQTRVSEIVVHNPASTRVFHRHGIDFCCGGKRPLAEACAERRLDAEQIRQEIAALDPGEAEEKDWSAEPLAAIVEHIVARYHQPLREEFPRLAAMAQKVTRAHGASHPQMIPALEERLNELAEDLLTHMMKEEQVLFPYIVALEKAVTAGAPLPRSPFGTVANPIAAMEADARGGRPAARGDEPPDRRLPASGGGLQHLPRPVPRPGGAGAGDAPPRAPGEQHPVPPGRRRWRGRDRRALAGSSSIWAPGASDARA